MHTDNVVAGSVFESITTKRLMSRVHDHEQAKHLLQLQLTLE